MRLVLEDNSTSQQPNIYTKCLQLHGWTCVGPVLDPAVACCMYATCPKQVQVECIIFVHMGVDQLQCEGPPTLFTLSSHASDCLAAFKYNSVGILDYMYNTMYNIIMYTHGEN